MKTRKIGTIVTVVAALTLLLAASSGVAGPPVDRGEGSNRVTLAGTVASKISYQGKLTDAGGNPLDGTYTMQFQLYDAQSGGTMLWDSGAQSVQVDSGLLNVNLDVDQDDFNGQELWLAVKVDGEWMTDRQQILPVPYALSLRPGAEITGNVGSPAALVAENTTASGVADGVWGKSASSSGAGIYGNAYATSGENYGVYGKSDSPDGRGVYGLAPSNGVYGAATGTGAGVHGVYGETSGDWGWASGVYGKASRDHAIGVTGWNTAGGAGVYGYSTSGVGVVASSESGSLIEAWDSDPPSRRFYVDNDGDVDIQGDLTVAGNLNAPAPTCVQYDVSVAGETTVDVPSFCIDRICMIVTWNGANMGGFGPGFSWPAFYMQSSADNSWIGGPNVFLAGVMFSDGAGVNGDASQGGVFLGGQTSAGGQASLYDDGTAETSPDLWTIELVPHPPTLTRASFYICPWFTPPAP